MKINIPYNNTFNKIEGLRTNFVKLVDTIKAQGQVNRELRDRISKLETLADARERVLATMQKELDTLRASNTNNS